MITMSLIRDGQKSHQKVIEKNIVKIIFFKFRNSL